MPGCVSAVGMRGAQGYQTELLALRCPCLRSDPLRSPAGRGLRVLPPGGSMGEA